MGFKKISLGIQLSQVHLSFSRQDAAQTQKPFQTRLISPLQRLKSEVLVASESLLTPSPALFMSC